MTGTEKNIKRLFDIFFATLGLIVLGWFIALLALISKIVIKGDGFFKQKRVGQHGNLFTIYKIETIYTKEQKKENSQITKLGAFMRKHKIDELPQLYNVLIGDMSFVGPRPDISGFADELKGESKIILSVKPGITGPATLFFRNEEKLLSSQKNPQRYNKEIIWPKKVALNIKYIKEYSLTKDFQFLYSTLLLQICQK